MKLVSIRTLCGEGDPAAAADGLRHPISIHALREEGDRAALPDITARVKISIHALREEGDITAERYKEITGISIHALREEGDV